jgi:hypothetical protein
MERRNAKKEPMIMAQPLACGVFALRVGTLDAGG